MHADSLHFNSEPFGAMCGVWTALEDIGPDQGPLIYYPGSHKLSELNYPDFDLPAKPEAYSEYLKFLQNIIVDRGFKPEYGILKKGQSLIWAANLLHGGSTQNNKELTRHSQVSHYFIGDPKCWTPSLSNTERFYFEPTEVRDVSGEPYQYPIQPEKEPQPIEQTFSNRLIDSIKRRLGY